MAFLHHSVKEITLNTLKLRLKDNELQGYYNSLIPHILQIRLGRPEVLNDLPKVTQLLGCGSCVVGSQVSDSPVRCFFPLHILERMLCNDFF